MHSGNWNSADFPNFSSFYSFVFMAHGLVVFMFKMEAPPLLNSRNTLIDMTEACLLGNSKCSQVDNEN